MKMALKTKMAFIFGVSSFFLIIMFFGVTNYIVKSSFQTYMEENQIKRDLALVNYVKKSYISKGQLNNDIIENIWHQALMNNFYITLEDKDKNVIWKMDRNTTKMMHGMMMRRRNSGKYIENTYPLDPNGKIIGYIKIGQYGSILLSEEDIHFKRSLNEGLIITAIIGLVLAIFLGMVIAQKLSKPIVQLKETTDILRQGNLQTRVSLNSNTKEISELKQSINHLANTLEEQELLRKRLTSDVSHELRTPLNILQNQLEALIDGIWKPTKERLQISHNEVLRLTNLVKDLEKLTSLDQHDLKLEKQFISLKKVILPVIHQFEPSLHAKNIQIDYNLNDSIEAWIDKDKITQVMINLLSNAYKFTDPSGKIFIDISQDEYNTMIRISDNGIGMSESDVKHIFERFYRAEQSRNRKTGGAGLGLSIVKRIIDAHGGTIKVESALNKGTTFIISIPTK